MIRRWIVVLLVILFGTVACGNDDSDDSGVSSESDNSQSNIVVASNRGLQPITPQNAPQLNELVRWESGGDVLSDETVLAFSPDSTRLAGYSGDQNIQTIEEVSVWEVDTGQLLETHYVGSDEFPVYDILDLRFGSDNSLLAVVVSGSEVLLWDTSVDRSVMSLARPGGIRTGKIASDASFFVVCCGGDQQETLMLKYRDRAGTQNLDVANNGNELALSDDGHIVAVADSNNVSIWDLDTQTNIAMYGGTSAALSPDGSLLAFSTEEIGGEVQIVEVVSGAFLHTVDGPSWGNHVVRAFDWTQKMQ